MIQWTVDQFIDFHGRRLLVDAEVYRQEYEKIEQQNVKARRVLRRYRRLMYSSLLLSLFMGFALIAHPEADWFNLGLGVFSALFLIMLFASSRRMRLSKRAWELNDKLLAMTRPGSSAPSGQQGEVSAEQRLANALTGEPEQWLLLGDAIMAGDGFRADTQVAMALWAMASDAGCSLGAYRMGCYYKRFFAKKNESLGWFYRAAALGSERALGELNEAGARAAKPIESGRGGRDFLLDHFGISLRERASQSH